MMLDFSTNLEIRSSSLTSTVKTYLDFVRHGRHNFSNCFDPVSGLVFEPCTRGMLSRESGCGGKNGAEGGCLGCGT